MARRDACRRRLVTKEELDKEISEKVEDLEAFTKARDLLYQRVLYVQDHSTSNITPLHEWAGTHAIMNTLDVVIHNMERMLAELKAIVPQTIKPQLRLVTNAEDS